MKLALGTVQFGLSYGLNEAPSIVEEQEAKAILDCAKRNGIDFLDTAISYGDSESVLGRIGVEAWKVVSKLPQIPNTCVDVEKWIKSQVDLSIERLNISNLHALLLHRPGQLLEPFGMTLYECLLDLRLSGLVNNIGISIYSPLELDELFKKFDFDFDIVQAPVNIFDHSLEQSGWPEKLTQKKIKIHARSVFLQGLLLLPPARRPKIFSEWANEFEYYDQWLANQGLNALEATLNHVYSKKFIDKIIVGVESVKQLNEVFDSITDLSYRAPKFLDKYDRRLLNPSRWYEL